MSLSFAQYRESADAITVRIGAFRPQVAMILGSGLGYLADLLEDAVSIPYSDIPHFRAPTAPGHRGRLVFGSLEGRKVAVMQGRIHHYEGYSYEEVAYPVRVLRLLGAGTMFVTNAAGAVNQAFFPGVLMLIADHIKLFGDSPLRGENQIEFGPRFPDASYLYTPSLQKLAKDMAADLNIPLRKGVYMYFPGPQYETPAEIRAARILGADAVGMSTVPEVIAAGHAGMRVLGLSLLSNMAAGILDQPLTEQEVLDAARAASDRFIKLILKCLQNLNCCAALLDRNCETGTDGMLR
ncbi:MAG: purine-nucleoside phosphorylase [Oscillospiraceae bacterium]|nr:purine-nucleoside phosphorylase [Oscillospiraceae bacterium]